MDKIFLKGVEIFCYHGVMEEEKRLGQKFRFDIEVSADTKKAGKSDNVSDTVSYAEIYDILKEAANHKKYNLLEALAEETAERILKMNGVKGVKVRIEKPSAPIAGIFDYAGVEIER